MIDTAQGEGTKPKGNDVIHLYNDGDESFPIGFWRGHLDLLEAKVEAEIYFDHPVTVEHDSCRLVPRVGLDYDSEFLLDQSGRGAFKATLILKP